MSGAEFNTFTCEHCGHSTWSVDPYGQQIEREWDGQTMCVSCYSKHKWPDSHAGDTDEQ